MMNYLSEKLSRAKRNVKEHRFNIIVFFLVAGIFFCLTYDKEKHGFPELFFHLSAEIIGAILIIVGLESHISKIKEFPYYNIVIKDYFDIKEFFKQVSSAKESIELLDTYLYHLTIKDRSTRDEFKNALIHFATGKSFLKNKSIKILILNPNSEAATQRAEDLNPKKPSEILDNMKKGVEIIHNIKDEVLLEIPESEHEYVTFEIKLFDTLPPFSMRMADNLGYWGFFEKERHSYLGPQLSGDKNGKIARVFYNIYQNMWNEPTAIPIENFIKSR